MHRHTEHWINRQKNSMQLNAVAYRGSKQIQDFGMNKFYIITNNEKDKNLEFTDRVVDYLGKRGGHCEVQLAGRQTAGPFHYTDPRRIPEETQCIIVLGGDGTLLQAARDIQAAHDKKRSQIPLLGVNLGNLGFLAEVDRQSVYQALDKLTEDVYEVEERMMLSGTVYRGDRVIGKDIALNDIVIAREGPLRVVRFKNFVNDEYLNSYNADGIIISTPTGSTGYSLSVGGPIVEMGEGRHQDCEKGLASFDGDSEIPMITGDKIVIRKAEVKTRILKLNHLSFVEVLRQKMRDS